jgi:hypothetical protein
MLENVYSFGGFNECRTSLQRRINVCMKIHPASNCVNVARKDSALDRRELLMRWRAASAAYRLGYTTLNPQTDYKSPRVNTTVRPSYISRGALNAKQYRQLISRENIKRLTIGGKATMIDNEQEEQESVIAIESRWEYDEDGAQSLDLVTYTDHPNWNGIVFDRKTGRLTRNNVFGGIGARRYEDWSRHYRYIQCADNYKGTRGACRYHLQDVKLIEEINDGYTSVLGCVVTVKYKGLDIGSESLWGIVGADKEYKATIESENASGAKAQARKWIADNLKPMLATQALAELETAELERIEE